MYIYINNKKKKKKKLALLLLLIVNETKTNQVKETDFSTI